MTNKKENTDHSKNDHNLDQLFLITIITLIFFQKYLLIQTTNLLNLMRKTI
jgi:hypothetical protein